MAETSLALHYTQEELKANELEGIARSAQYFARHYISNLIDEYLDRYAKGQRNWKPAPSKELNNHIHELLLLSFLLGNEHAKPNVHLADLSAWKENKNKELADEPLDMNIAVHEIPFEEAIKFVRARVPLSKEQYYDLEDKLRFRAFTVGRLTQLDAINAVRAKLTEALEEGQTFPEFMEESGKDALLDAAGWGKQEPWYYNLVYRMNVQTAYNGGRALEVQETNPVMMEYIGIDDDRQTEICQVRSGVILNADDPWWNNNWPPNHWNCRSTVRLIYPEEVTVRRLRPTPNPPDSPPPMPGFGGNPLSTGSFYLMTESMKQRAKQYGILGEIRKLANEIGLKKKIEMGDLSPKQA